jgi:hypothetical protein
MRFVKLVVIGVLGLGLTGSTVLFAQNNNAAEFMSTSDAVKKIKSAKTVSDAVTAYADAVRGAGDSVGVKQAFIVRMVDLGAPEMAENQARDLADLSGDPMSSAVLAYSAAKRNELDASISHLAKAVDKSPTNGFVAATAGEVLAWYDVKTAMEPNTQVNESTRKAVEDIRSDVGRRNDFTTAYGRLMNQMVPQPMQQAASDSGTRIHLVNGDVDEVTTYGAAAEEKRLSPLALFFAAPYGGLPPNLTYAFGYGYGGYGYDGYGYGGYAYGRPIPPADYYYYDYWNRGAGPLFPFPSISRDTRYLRLPGSGFALITDGNPVVYQSLNPWYDGRFAPYSYYPQRPYFYGGYAGGGRRHDGGFNNNFRRQNDGGIIVPFSGVPGSPFQTLGNGSRLSQRMRGDDPIVNTPLYNVTSPYGGAVVPVRPGPQPFFGR